MQEKRGGVIAIYALGPVLGPVIGPVAGGYLAAAKGWRGVFWVLTIVGGFCTIVCFIFLRETYPTVLLKRKTQRLIKETGNTVTRTSAPNETTASPPVSSSFKPSAAHLRFYSCRQSS